MKSLPLFFIVLLLSIIAEPLRPQWRTIQQYIVDENLNAVCYPRENAAFIIGDFGTAMFSPDSGSNWITIDDIVTNSDLQHIIFLDENLGYIVGESGTIFKTETSGATWIDQSIEHYYHLQSITFNDYGYVIAVGEKEVRIDQDTYFLASILVSTNNGESWQDHTFDERGKFNSVFFLSSDVAVAVGDSGRVARTTDAGLFWESIPIETTANLNAIVSIPNNLVYIVGDQGIVLTSNNWGLDWIDHSIPEWFNMRSVCYNDNNEVVSVGIKQVRIDGKTYFLPGVVVFTNSGENWEDKSLDIRGRLNSLSFCSSSLALAVGDSGLIIVNENLVSEIDEKHPIISKEFNLIQNYPNPFNPSTTIKYEIKELTDVELKVFDILGREIITLINEEKPAGSYEIDFNASHLTSGVYFYQLTAGSFVETKKMVLVK